MSRLFVYDHPLIHHKLAELRDKNTDNARFRALIGEIATLMCYEATRDLPTDECEVETPVATAKVFRLDGKSPAIVPILRAGLGMVEGVLSVIPEAKVGHIGLARDPETLQPVEYYCKLPADISEREVLVTDPMLATGGSAAAAVRFLKERGCRSIRLLSIIAAPEGVAHMQSEHPDVDIYVAAMDERLNSHGYIVPGLGDAGDRIFGTE